MSENATDLSFVTLDEIVEELAKRYPAVVLIAEREAEGDENGVDRPTFIKGAASTVVGLLALTRRHVMKASE